MAKAVRAIDVDELGRCLGSNPAPFVLDVREPWEFAAGHVPHAHHIPLGELESRVGEVPRDQSVLVICQVGSRSEAAAAYLGSLGYVDVANVDGGTSAWIERGNPIER